MQLLCFSPAGREITSACFTVIDQKTPDIMKWISTAWGSLLPYSNDFFCCFCFCFLFFTAAVVVCVFTVVHFEAVICGVGLHQIKKYKQKYQKLVTV